MFTYSAFTCFDRDLPLEFIMEKRKLGESYVKLPRKTRAVSGYNLHHAECMRSAGNFFCCMYTVYEYCMILESLSCTSLQEKNCFSATKWRSLSDKEKGEYNDKATAIHSTSAEDSVVNVKQEITKLLKRLQELVCILIL